MRQRAAGQAGAGPATDHRHAPLATHAQGLQHLRHRRRQRHQQRRLPIRAQTIALINAQRIGVIDDRITRQKRAQPPTKRSAGGRAVHGKFANGDEELHDNGGDKKFNTARTMLPHRRKLRRALVIARLSGMY